MNGWRNRETWLVGLHYNPETKQDLELIKLDVEEQVDLISSLFIKDMICTSEIDWQEIEDSLDDE